MLIKAAALAGSANLILIFDAEKGRLLGVLLTSPKRFIPAEEISGWTPKITFKNGKNVSELPEKGVALMDMKVFTKSSDFRGIVRNLEFDSDTLHLHSITADKSLLVWHFDQRIIPRAEILTIEKDRIVIKDDLMTVPAVSVTNIFNNKKKEIGIEGAG